MRNLRTTLTAALLAIVLCACAKPLPAERAPYVGVWRGGPMVLVLCAGGRLAYQRKEGNRSTTVNAPVKEFRGDNFIAGVGFMNTEFVVSAPPHEADGAWHMTVDGVDVAKTAEDPDQVADSMNSST